MELTAAQVREAARVLDLDIPEADIENVRLRLTTMLASMAEIERTLGSKMDETEPVPPVYPREEF